MASELGDFGICHRLMELASDADNQAFILKEKGCMTGLVRYLDNPAAEVVSMAARTVWLLGANPANRATLLAQPGLLDKLTKLSTSSHDTVRRNVSKAMSCLGAPPTTAEAEHSRPSERTPAKTNAPKAAVMKIDGLEAVTVRDIAIKTLLGVKGVTSVTIDQRKGQVTIYTRSDVDIHAELVEATKQVQSVAARDASRAVSAGEADLEYLDENDAPTPADAALAHRSGKISLESRLAEKREQQQQHLRKRDVVRNVIGRVLGSFW